MFNGIVLSAIFFILVLLAIQVSFDSGLYMLLICSTIFNIYLILQINRRKHKD